ncbi:sensor histidine kinase [Foetidibacter luteolus]|uniref:sensor histidine kinase n=1 Tax=Foetidibacter luteolus TaxID=2608880 RepID=UPI00129B373E|nr:histidine kinase [Foetidibacter luteolus]
MKLVKPTKLQWLSFWLPMPVITYIMMLIMYGEDFYTYNAVWQVAIPLLYAIGINVWYSEVALMHAIQTRYPGIQHNAKRVLLLVCLAIPVMSVSMVTIFMLYDRLNIAGYDIKQGDIFKGIILGFSVNLIFMTSWEGDYILRKYKQSLQEKETLEQLSIQQEFELLKSQVNPHFLFNCFNTLSSLITEDTKRADAFLNELSKVYRYLLSNNEDSLSTLQKELSFIKSYHELLKTRYGSGLEMQVDVDRKYEQYLIPSLTLQLLVENAVKHNVVSKGSPLLIDIFTTTGNKLVINNNLQKKSQAAPSTKIGLENIRSKYELLNKDGFRVLEDDKNFTVILPLIWQNNIIQKQKTAQAHLFNL